MDRYDKMGGDFDMHAGGFSELIGNEQIKEHFLHAISSGKVSHCYVISGEDGLGSGKGICTDIGVSGRTCQQTVRRVPFMHTIFER